jgi:dolichol kinase
MHDLAVAALWAALLAGGLGACVLLFRVGMPRTYVRDLLHIGAGSWVLGWPGWSGWIVPTAIPILACAGLALLPRFRSLSGVRDSVSGDDEKWTGLVLYALAFAILTPIGLLKAPFPAAAALLALAIGDGVGGAIGRRFGKTRFRVGTAKHKSLEGAFAVALGAFAGIALANARFGANASLSLQLGAAVIAAIAEALSPRASDNLLLPGAVFVFVFALGG